MKPFQSILFSVVFLLGFYQPAKAQYIIKEADAQYQLYNYIKAIDIYEQAYKKKATLHAAERLALSYAFVQNYKEAESWYAIALKMPDSKPINMLNYAKILQNNAKYSEAKEAYIKYAAMDKQVTEAQKNTWVLSCDSALIWMRSPKAVNISNLKALNSPKSDWGAVAYQKGVVFSSDRVNDEVEKQKKPFLKFDAVKLPDNKIYGWAGNNYLSLYEQTEPSAAPHLFSMPVITGYHVGPASFTADENEMYFTLTQIPKKPVYEQGKLATVNIEIYSCKKDDVGKWMAPVAFKYNNVNKYSVGDPCISKDGKGLYFVSNMPGGKGGTDIYYCEKTSNGEWNQPVNLADINTSGNERSPSFDSESNFYFSSDGRIGMGGLDIYMAKANGGHFSEPVNMAYPINSPQDDFAYTCNLPGFGYFTSNRTTGLGSDDVYGFSPQKALVFKLEGSVYQKGTQVPLANVLVSLNKKDGNTLKVQSDTQGNFKFDLEDNTTYELIGEKTNYRNDQTEISTVNLVGTTQINKNLYLEPIVLYKEIRLDNIYYDFDKWNIRADAAIELDKLVKLLKDNPTMWIEIGSHTDSRGNGQYNQLLSQKRANSVTKYIVDRGINKNRITAKGYGATRLLNRCAPGIKCTETEHQLNRRTEFKIIK